MTTLPDYKVEDYIEEGVFGHRGEYKYRVLTEDKLTATHHTNSYKDAERWFESRKRLWISNGCDTCKHCDEGVDDNGMGWDLDQYDIWTYRDCNEGHDIEKEPRTNCADYEPKGEE